MKGNNKGEWKRFIEKVEVDLETGCWNWLGALSQDGYSLFPTRFGHSAHVYAYLKYNYEITEGLILDHLCRNRACVNPNHLEPVTSGENTRRGINYWKERTHCKNGHEFAPENTGIVKREDGGTHRRCKTCYQEKYKARYNERKFFEGSGRPERIKGLRYGKGYSITPKGTYRVRFREIEYGQFNTEEEAIKKVAEIRKNLGIVVINNKEIERKYL